MVRRESKEANAKRITTGNPSEIWRGIRDLMNPRRTGSVKLIVDGTEEKDEKKVANIFNTFFIRKVQKLREDIDDGLKEDPTRRLRQRMQGRDHRFQLHPASEIDISKAFRKLKPKKSSGMDGISQELLKSIESVVKVPLQLIVNTSISTGTFPECWKHSKTVPIHKKDDPTLPSNYRPVSCLPVASKILESIVLTQLTDYFERNRLLPEQQHGFRSGRSTTTAVASMIAEWSKAHEENKTTGVLLWDLSCAFDTIDPNLLCSKLEIYGVKDRSIRWFKSFLTNRKQTVQVGSSLSEPGTLSVGCPQGSLLSPLLFLIYIADMELWVKHASIRGYADDTASSVSADVEDEVINKLETDADHVLKFMASNFLMANPKKTGFLLIRKKQSTLLRTIKVGGQNIIESNVHRILGLTVNSRLSWADHIYGEGRLLSSINQRIGALKRISHHVPIQCLPQSHKL